MQRGHIPNVGIEVSHDNVRRPRDLFKFLEEGLEKELSLLPGLSARLPPSPPVSRDQPDRDAAREHDPGHYQAPHGPVPFGLKVRHGNLLQLHGVTCHKPNPCGSSTGIWVGRAQHGLQALGPGSPPEGLKATLRTRMLL
eukprot:3183700-Alexandrium_andersonii.AAC.1